MQSKMMLTATVLGLGLLTACGGASENNSNVAEAASDTSDSSSTPTASASLDCANFSNVGPTVQGIKLGMSPAEAEAALKCADPNFQISWAEGDYNNLTADFYAQKPRAKMDGSVDTPGGSHDRVSAFFIGQPGEEKVAAISREAMLGQSERPLKKEFFAQLDDKYGKLENTSPGDNPRQIDIGRAVGANGAALPRQDGGYMDTHCFTTEGINVSPDCGLSVSVRGMTDSGNSDMVSSFSLQMDNGSYAAGLVKALEAKVEQQKANAASQQSSEAAGRKTKL